MNKKLNKRVEAKSVPQKYTTISDSELMGYLKEFNRRYGKAMAELAKK